MIIKRKITITTTRTTTEEADSRSESRTDRLLARLIGMMEMHVPQFFSAKQEQGEER